jgi:hypothetical protein
MKYVVANESPLNTTFFVVPPIEDEKGVVNNTPVPVSSYKVYEYVTTPTPPVQYTVIAVPVFGFNVLGATGSITFVIAVGGATKPTVAGLWFGDS